MLNHIQQRHQRTQAADVVQHQTVCRRACFVSYRIAPGCKVRTNYARPNETEFQAVSMYDDGIPAGFRGCSSHGNTARLMRLKTIPKRTENELTHDTPTQDPYLSSPHAPIASRRTCRPKVSCLLALDAFEGCVMRESIGAFRGACQDEHVGPNLARDALLSGERWLLRIDIRYGLRMMLTEAAASELWADGQVQASKAGRFSNALEIC